MIECTCNICGKIIKRYPSQVKSENYCSRKCAAASRITSCELKCFVCGKIFTRPPSGIVSENPCCSLKCSGLKKISDELKKEINSPYKCSKVSGSNQRRFHRAIVEKHLGVKLPIEYTVHHINGDKHDNRIENLEVFATTNEHSAYHAGNPSAKPIWSGRGIKFCRDIKDNWKPTTKRKHKVVKSPSEFNSMARSNGYILESRLIIAYCLNRPLIKGEFVHHVDNDAQNNRVENLLLFKSCSDAAKFRCGEKITPIFDGRRI